MVKLESTNNDLKTQQRKRKTEQHDPTKHQPFNLKFKYKLQDQTIQFFQFDLNSI